MNSDDMQRLRTTQQRGYQLGGEVETQETVEVHSMLTASGDGRNNV